MTLVLLGTTTPIELKERPVPDDIDEARAELAALTRNQADPQEWVDEQTDEQVRLRLAGHRETHAVPCPSGESIVEIRPAPGLAPLAAVKSCVTAWKACSATPPVWIECDDPALGALLMAAFTSEAGAPLAKMPDGWMPESEPAWNTEAGFATLRLLLFPFLVLVALAAQAKSALALRTNAGRDFQSRVMGDGTEGTAGTGNMRPADYLALTENATAPALGDTTLTAELAAGGLARAQATYAHTAASTTYTLIYEWTSSDGTARTIRKMGVFNAASAGTMVFESLVPDPPTLVAGDSLEVTETVDIS